MFAKIREKLNNRGSSFVVIIVSMAFLSILAASILTAVGYSYKLKLYNLNSKNNFYYLEQAMDEVYAGVGNVAVGYLQQAYHDTIEVMVYYDPQLRAYVTRKDEDANYIMKQTFIKYITDATEFSSAVAYTDANGIAVTELQSTIMKCVTNPKVEVDVSKVQMVPSADGGLIIQNVTLKRAANYSVALNTETYQQSITTDIVLSKPNYDVSFANTNDSFSALYDFAIIADSGIEIKNAASVVNVSGDLYGGADFYNKTYNKYTAADIASSVSSYVDSETRYKTRDGLQEDSMYSGLYIDGAKVSLQSNNVVVPGTVGVFNNGTLLVAAKKDGAIVPSNLWTDSIVLGGYTTAAGGSEVNLNTNAYIYDDMEINADYSKLKLQGKYYGYNYSQVVDTRNFIGAAESNYVNPSDKKKHTTHYNSSAIIMNGQGTELDLLYLDAMYIAGRSYIELSKATEKKDTSIGSGDAAETVVTKTYTYDRTVDDYVTGESLSIRSNQVAYQALKTWDIDDVDKGSGVHEYHASIDPIVRDAYDYRDPAEPGKIIFEDLDKVPLIKQVVDSDVYYFLKFEDSEYTAADGTKKIYTADEKRQNFLIGYSKFFELADNQQYANKGAKYLKDITNYERFQIGSIDMPADMQNKIYSNGLLTVKDATTFSIMSSQKTADVFKDMLTTEQAAAEFAYMTATEELGLQYNLMKYFLTTEVSTEYREYMKNMTTVAGFSSLKAKTDQEAVDFVKDMEAMMSGSDVSTLSLTPFVKYFNLAKITGSSSTGVTLPSGYRIWVCAGDVEIADVTGGDGNIMGIVIAKGDVTFNANVKSFQGLIVSGSKVKIEHTINFIANPEVVKSALRECNSSSDTNIQAIVDCFKGYGESQTGTTNVPVVNPSTDTSTDIIDASNVDALEKDITEISIDDVIAYDNWKKNVE